MSIKDSVYVRCMHVYLTFTCTCTWSEWSMINMRVRVWVRLEPRIVLSRPGERLVVIIVDPLGFYRATPSNSCGAGIYYVTFADSGWVFLVIGFSSELGSRRQAKLLVTTTRWKSTWSKEYICCNKIPIVSGLWWKCTPEKLLDPQQSFCASGRSVR